MSQETQASRSWVGVFVGLYVVVPAVVIIGLIVFLFSRGTKSGGPEKPPEQQAQGENFLAQVRSTLMKQADITTCRSVVQQLNGHLQQAGNITIPSFSKEETQRLTTEMGLSAGDVDELTRKTYSPLDAHHMEACFLFRDAARVMELTPLSHEGKLVRQSPLERAQVGFDWVVRQVRLQPPLLVGNQEPAPSAAVLRRGHGTQLERALVYLALLEQFGLDEDDPVGLQGCLVFCPDEKGTSRFWCCGVAVGTKSDNLYLFDPRLGMALPGPGGKGVATLKQACEDPQVLGQLKADKLTYDVTSEQAKKATVGVICPLSATARRMQYLQDRLLRDRTYQDQQLPMQVRVRLAEEPDRLVKQMQSLVPMAKVSFWKEGVILLRRFLPKDEGGSDEGLAVPLRALEGFTVSDDPAVAKLGRQEVFRLEAVPWSDFPPPFRNPQDFSYQLELGRKLRGVFMGPFIRPLIDPNSPRELLLRGKFNQAVRELVPEQDKWQQIARRLREARDLGPGLQQWRQRAIEVYAEIARSRGTANEVNARQEELEVWKWKFGSAMDVYLNGHIAGPLSADLTYQLALTRHEQASRYQNRLALAGRAGITVASDLANARKTWTDAEGYWKEFIDLHGKRPGVADARRLRGIAQQMLGRMDQAKETLQDVSSPMTPLEKLGQLWRAAQVVAPKN